MPRVNRVKKARKNQGNCLKCGEPIPAGSSYIWWKFGGPAGRRGPGGPKVKRCAKPGCYPKRSELTRSPFLSAIYSAEDEMSDALGSSPEEAAELLRSAAEMLREAAEIRHEAADAIEGGFGHSTQQSEQLQEEGDSAEQWADEVEDAAVELDDYDEGEVNDDVDSWVEGIVDNALSASPF